MPADDAKKAARGQGVIEQVAQDEELRKLEAQQEAEPLLTEKLADRGPGRNQGFLRARHMQGCGQACARDRAVKG